MISRRIAVITSLVVTGVSCFTLGVVRARHVIQFEPRLRAFTDDLRPEPALVEAVPVATAGVSADSGARITAADGNSRAQMIAEIKEQLQNDMGLLPLSLLRERRESFVQLYSRDNRGDTNYGTAGYLGSGYFITVKHAVVVFPNDANPADDRKITELSIVYAGKEIPASLVDVGDARMEMERGDWAIIRTRNLNLPPLRVDTAFAYDFADPIFRLGNDYSKGIVVSTGYIGQRTPGGLVTSLTDGHPGASGGGVLDRRGVLVGIPIGRMMGDYRFSFILPLRDEMLRKVPVASHAARPQLPPS